MFPSGSRKTYSLRSSLHTGGLNPIKDSSDIENGGNSFLVCLIRKVFQEFPDTIIHEDRQMMVVVHGLQPHCWLCKQLGHIVMDCPQKKMECPPKEPMEKPKGVSTMEPGDKQEGWTVMVKKRKTKYSATTPKSTSDTPDKSPAKVTTKDPVNKKPPAETSSSPPPSRLEKQTKETTKEEPKKWPVLEPQKEE